MSDISSSISHDAGGRGALKLIFIKGKQNNHDYLAGAVTVATLLDILEMPDPNKPLEDNRQVNKRHCELFADYVLKNPDPENHLGWTCPPIMARVDPNQLEEMNTLHSFDDGIHLVEVQIPRSLQFRILDGQHRSLGFSIARRRCSDEIDKAAQLLSMSTRNAEPTPVLASHEKTLNSWKAKQKMLVDAVVMLEIAIVDRKMARQMFVDIAQNAKGVNPDYTKVLDQRESVNRIAMDLIDTHPLLKGHTELGQSKRMSKTNTNLIGAKSVTDIVRAIFAGSGRIGARVNDELGRNQTAKTSEVKEFLDALVSSFIALRNIVDGTLGPIQLRDSSLLGSATMLRVLAVTWHELLESGVKSGEIEAFFKALDPHMGFKKFPAVIDNDDDQRDPKGNMQILVGIPPDDEIWAPTGVFSGTAAKAPGARQGDIRRLANALKMWMTDGNPLLPDYWPPDRP